MSDTAIDTASQHADRHVDEWLQWLRIPSVSSDRKHDSDTQQAASWVAEKLARAGLQVEQIPTHGHPIIYAETPKVADAPVVMVYGHYDVQPAEPLDLWTTPPFEPSIRDGNVYARGATDDKGQLLTHVHSVCDRLVSGETLPLQIKFLIEGEEEVGSQNLERMLPEMSERLACDCVVISDSGQYADGQPAITYGLRGIATYEVTVTGPAMDLHSGSFGGAVANPGIALCHLISSMVDGHGRIQIPGFYDDVIELTDHERSEWAKLPQDDAAFASAVGTAELFGESNFTTDERRWARPTLDVNGITCGHQGDGVKTIIPSVATAKFSCRLVPGQDPAKITEGIRQHIANHTLPGITIELHPDHGAPAMVAATDSPYMASAKTAIEAAFGVAPVMIREGGSIPIVAQFQSVLDCDCLLLGWGLSDDNCHSPNEKFRVADFHRGIAASAELWNQLGNIST